MLLLIEEISKLVSWRFFYSADFFKYLDLSEDKVLAVRIRFCKILPCFWKMIDDQDEKYEQILKKYIKIKQSFQTTDNKTLR
jgi:hypothetical protein